MAENTENVVETARDQDVNPWSVAGGRDEAGNAVGIDYEALSK
jgi:hypothetical protein